MSIDSSTNPVGHDSRLGTIAERESTHAPLPLGEGSEVPAGALASPRYAIESMVGSGATSSVFAARDRVLDRTVALKVLAAGSGRMAARFIREARITASIDHPNVVSVYDLEFNPSGTACMVMRRIEGRSLGEALRADDLGGINQLVTIILKVCDALARAHDRQVIHQDIKPDNIMLGSFGEVVVLDWGEARILGDASTTDKHRSVGTPAFMSPEQARAEPADQRSDVYCLAATAWVALTGKYPVWADNVERFWERKRAGDLDPLPNTLERRLPRHLLAILRKGLAADPAARYQQIAEFSGDLLRFQAGLAVTAHRDQLWEVLAAACRRNARGLAAVALVVVAFIGAGGWIAFDRQREQASWGEPVVHEDFHDDSWQKRWRVSVESSWKRENGCLISTSPNAAEIYFRQRLTGSVAIEYDGCVLPDFRPGDLSVLWTETDKSTEDAASDVSKDFTRRFVIQAGGFSNTLCEIVRLDPASARLAVVRERLVAGRWYHIRIELDGRDVRMLVDGKIIMQHQDMLPIGDGYISLYGYYPGKAFKNVTVWQKRLPELIPAIALGNEALRLRQHGKAAEQFRRCAESFPDTAMGAEAVFKWGLALDRDGKRGQARQAWELVPAGPWRILVDEEQLEDLWRAGRTEAAMEGLINLYRNEPVAQAGLRSRWMVWCATRPTYLKPSSQAVARALLHAKTTSFPENDATDWAAAILVEELDGPQAALDRFPDELYFVVSTLAVMGRDEEILRRFPELTEEGTRALMRLGRYQEVLAQCSTEKTLSLALALMGRSDEARLRYPEEPYGWLYGGDWAMALKTSNGEVRPAVGLFAAGKWKEVTHEMLDHSISDGAREDDRRCLYLYTGTYERVSTPEQEPAMELAWGVIRWLAEGNTAQAASWSEHVARRRVAWSKPCEWFWVSVVTHLPQLIAGDPAPLRAALVELAEHHRTEQAGRAWAVASRALGLIDDATVLAQPTQAEAQAWLAIAQALQAELAGDRAAAAAAWSCYLALPRQLRLLGSFCPDPVIEALAAWRAAP